MDVVLFPVIVCGRGDVLQLNDVHGQLIRGVNPVLQGIMHIRVVHADPELLTDPRMNGGPILLHLIASACQPPPDDLAWTAPRVDKTGHMLHNNATVTLADPQTATFEFGQKVGGVPDTHQLDIKSFRRHLDPYRFCPASHARSSSMSQRRNL